LPLDRPPLDGREQGLALGERQPKILDTGRALLNVTTSSAPKSASSPTAWSWILIFMACLPVARTSFPQVLERKARVGVPEQTHRRHLPSRTPGWHELALQKPPGKPAMGRIERIAAAIAAILAREGVDYLQSKAVFKAARQKAGLTAPPDRHGGIDRLTLEEELRFIDQAYAKGGRTGLMLQTLLETGARVSELVQLRIEDVSLAERVVVVRRGKGGKRREVPIRRELAQLLQLHIGSRRAGPLFPSRQKGSGPVPHVLTRQRVGQVVREVARAASIAKRVYPHLLRHTMATRLLTLGMEITDVQRFLGHEDLATTRRYAETTAAVLQRKFDQLADPAAHRLVAAVQHRRGDEAAVVAAELLTERRRERLTSAGA
jgi:integrase/recombinase XerD